MCEPNPNAIVLAGVPFEPTYNLQNKFTAQDGDSGSAYAHSFNGMRRSDNLDQRAPRSTHPVTLLCDEIWR